MKEINGFNDYYIDKAGRIYSKKTGKLKELSPFLDSQKRYLLIRLIDNNGIRKTKLLHRLVAETFLPNPENLPEINHKDKNTKNPKLENLE